MKFTLSGLPVPNVEITVYAMVIITAQAVVNNLSGKIREPSGGCEMNELKVYTRKRLAEVFGVHRNTVHGWVKDGKLKPSFGTAEQFFTEEAILEFLAKREKRQSEDSRFSLLKWNPGNRNVVMSKGD